MNRAKTEALIEQYKTDPSIIFAMPAIVQEVPCGTAMCYAGQVCANEGYELVKRFRLSYLAVAVKGEERWDAWDLAQAELELDEDETHRLFQKDDWPEDLREQPDTPALAAERLQRFLDSNGRE